MGGYLQLKNKKSSDYLQLNSKSDLAILSSFRELQYGQINSCSYTIGFLVKYFLRFPKQCHIIFMYRFVTFASYIKLFFFEGYQ